MDKIEISEEDIKVLINDKFFNYTSVDDFKNVLSNDPGKAYFDLSTAMQINGKTEKDWAKYLLAAANFHCEGAMEQLADFYYDEDNKSNWLPYNQKKAIDIYKELARKNNAKALYQLAIYYIDAETDEHNINIGKQYLEKVGELSESLRDRVAYNFLILGDYDKALYFYKKAKVFEDSDTYLFDVDDEGIMVSFYSDISYIYYLKNDIENAYKYANKGIELNDESCLALKGKYSFEQGNIDEAFSLLNKVKNNGESNYLLGMIYNNKNYKYYDKVKAFMRFQKAKKQGYICDFSLFSLQNEIQHNDSDKFTQFIYNTIEHNDLEKFPKVVEEDLMNEFGDYWENLSEFSKNVLITGVVTLLMYVKCDSKNPMAILDYSPIIVSISRALERELLILFYDKFIKYIIKENVELSEFKKWKKFVFKDDCGLYYINKENWFTLGKFKIMVDEQKKNKIRETDEKTIDRNLLRYCSHYLFKDKAFGKNKFNRNDEISEYMIDLANQINDITTNYRNEAAHTNSISSFEKAKSCVDWVIKVKQLLLHLIEKVDYEKLKRL